MLLFATALLSASTLAGPTTAPSQPSTQPLTQQGSTYAIRARTIHVGGGETIKNGVILIENDKIRAVGPNLSVPNGATVIEHDGVVTAGLIALHGYSGTKVASGGGQTIILSPFGRAEQVTESWKQHVHGHAELEDEAEEVLVDRGEEVDDEPVEEDSEHAGHGHDEHGDDEHGEEEEHEHGGTTDPEPVEVETIAPVEDGGLFAAREVVVDSTRTVIAEAETAHAFNPASADFRRALEAGITTLVLTPDAQSLVPGQTAVVKSSGRVVDRNAHLSLGFSSRALRSDRYPTSLSGAVAELDQRFAKPEGVFKEAATGKLPILFEVGGRQDVLRAADFAKRHKLSGAVNGASRVGEVAEAIKAAGLSAVVGPFPIGASGRELRSVVELAKTGVPFGFGMDAPRQDPEVLRISAASCIGQGLDPVVAWSALTDTAARIAGVETRVGRLAAGLDADLVLWSGHPLDLGSRPATVIVDGQMLVGGAQ